MKLRLNILVVLVIVLLLSTLNCTPQNTPKDSVLVSIESIKVANLIFVERDYYATTISTMATISSTNVKVVQNQDTVIEGLNSKIDNLKLILRETKSKQVLEEEKIRLELTKKMALYRDVAGGSLLLVLLILLL